jgi:hypothetical protein
MALSFDDGPEVDRRVTEAGDQALRGSTLGVASLSQNRNHEGENINENGLENPRAWSPLRPRKRRHDRGQMATPAAHQARTSLVRRVRRPVRQRWLQPVFNQSAPVFAIAASPSPSRLRSRRPRAVGDITAPSI